MKCRIIDGATESMQDICDSLGMRDKMDLKPIINTVEEIIENVRIRGDEAVCEYTQKFDRAQIAPNQLRVTESEIELAMNEADTRLLRIMRKAADNIKRFHEMQIEKDYSIDVGENAKVGLMVRPLSIAGIYIPAGSAPLFSTVLMDVIPAKTAGVERVVLCTPPRADGTIEPTTLAAARIAGVDEIYKIGGAQAVAAMAYGTDTVPQVDKICGPGNIYVNTAKRLVFGQVDIDMFAGPSEILIIADDSADARFVAADMLAQAEHDALASAILLTTDAGLAQDVAEEIDRQYVSANRKDILDASLKDYCAIIVVKTLDEAFAFSNALAPEHLELCIRNPEEKLLQVINAGAVFIGNYSPESLGDYYAGPNHTLPTSGTARFFSPLNVGDFLKKISLIQYDEDALKACWKDVSYFAEAEGLDAHARAVRIRFEEK